MTALAWDQIGDRYFETGSDRGVLYLPGADGVAWNGLTGVQQTPSGGETTPLYYDGVKYLDLMSSEEFQATISAFTYPEEFALCDGSAEIDTGLFATQQPRLPFGLSYRTKIGNDLEGTDHAYKLHIVWNATASPSDKTYVTISETVAPSNFSWLINTVPEFVSGYKPTAHFEVDSRKANALVLEELESILYGSATTEPRLPTPAEVIALFEEWDALIVIEDHGDGTWSATGPSANITMLDATTFQITGVDGAFLDADTYEISTTH